MAHPFHGVLLFFPLFSVMATCNLRHSSSFFKSLHSPLFLTTVAARCGSKFLIHTAGGGGLSAVLGLGTPSGNSKASSTISSAPCSSQASSTTILPGLYTSNTNFSHYSFRNTHIVQNKATTCQIGNDNICIYCLNRNCQSFELTLKYTKGSLYVLPCTFLPRSSKPFFLQE